MIFVIFACIRPWVRKRAAIDKMKDLRFINPPCRTGVFAYFSTNMSIASDNTAAIRTNKKALELHPKF